MHSQNSPQSEGIEKLGKMIGGIEVAMMTTWDGDHLRSRPMMTQRADFNGSLWFFTRRNSHKVAELNEDQMVNLSFSSPKDERYVSIAGRARMVSDPEKAKELWNPVLRTWFPQGLDDPELALIEVQAETAEYWDAPSSKMVHLFGLAKSLTTGKSPEPGDHHKVDLTGTG